MKLKKKLNYHSKRNILLRRMILQWYDKNGRHTLPWKNTSIYLIWISEIMLQQTQVKTVIPYFMKFKHRFPTLKSLIKSDLNSILQSWSGLGYYRRARNIYEACRIIKDKHNGIFPKKYEEILDLPGIGRTTASAIATFSNLGTHTILDANVKRFLIRLNDIKVKNAKLDQELWITSEKLLSNKRPADFIQAYMDIGSLICKNSNPLCNICPVKNHCHSKDLSNMKTYVSPRQTKPSKLNIWALAIRDRDGRYYLEKISLNKLWEGLYSSPVFLKKKDLDDWASYHGLSESLDTKIKTFRHKLSHFDISFSVKSCHIKNNKNISLLDDNWYNLSEVDKGVPKFQDKIIKSIN